MSVPVDGYTSTIVPHPNTTIPMAEPFMYTQPNWFDDIRRIADALERIATALEAK